MVVLRALEGGEAKVGKLLLWLSIALFGSFAVIFFVTPEPWSEKLPYVPWLVGAFALFAGYSVWIIRKPYRVHRMPLAKILRERPEDVIGVHEIAIRPSATGQGIVQTRVGFDGEREFAPRSKRVVRVLGLMKVVERSQVFIKVRGKFLSRKLVVTSDRAPELLSWLFATLAAANPECRWGETTIASHTG